MDKKKAKRKRKKTAQLDIVDLVASVPSLEHSADIPQRSITAVIRELGPVDSLRFFATMSPGKGDYTRDRYKVTPKMTMEELRQHVLDTRKKYGIKDA
jgi:hypothetical protein